MKRLHPILKAFVPMVKALAETLGPDCEVVLHDVSDPERSVVAIENGHVTGRTIGSPLTDFGLYLLRSPRFKNVDYVANYMTRTNDGRKLRSTTVFIRDEAGGVIGFLCINYDTTKAFAVKEFVEQYLKFQNLEELAGTKEERFVSKVEELLLEAMQEIKSLTGKPLRFASKEEKLAVIKKLDEKGFFLLKGAVEMLAKELGNSKFTVYAYLREARKKGDSIMI
ncbi:helix-turn-helix transcriptional regulator [Pseudothermotoga sp.]|jgi:predicted transcriptional regulator YheO